MFPVFAIFHLFQTVGWHGVVEGDGIGIRVPKHLSTILSTFVVDPINFEPVHFTFSPMRYQSWFIHFVRWILQVRWFVPTSNPCCRLCLCLFRRSTAVACMHLHHSDIESIAQKSPCVNICLIPSRKKKTECFFFNVWSLGRTHRTKTHRTTDT